MHRIMFVALLVFGIWLGLPQVSPGWAAEPDPASGKEVSILIGTGAGGGYDISARVFARHFGLFLPGHPTVVARNVPGAGGLRLANQIYNVSSKDGTELGLFPSSVALEPLYHNSKAKFDTSKFTWIGNMDSDSADGCGTWRHSGIRTWADLKTRLTTFGSAGPSGVSSMYPKVIATLLNLKTKVILGYSSTHNVLRAMQSGELDGSCALNLHATHLEFSQQIQDGDLTIWISFGRKRSSEFPNIPTIFELLKNENDLEVAKLIFGQDRINRAVSAPPGVAAKRTEILRAAFNATIADKQFLQDAAKTGITVNNPMTGEETRNLYLSFYQTPPSIVERAIKIMGLGTE